MQLIDGPDQRWDGYLVCTLGHHRKLRPVPVVASYSFASRIPTWSCGARAACPGLEVCWAQMTDVQSCHIPDIAKSRTDYEPRLQGAFFSGMQACNVYTAGAQTGTTAASFGWHFGGTQNPKRIYKLDPLEP